jgi:hypothetical protein
MWAASNPAGFGQKLSPDTVWLLNRRAIAQKWGCSPVEVETWPVWEVAVELQFMQIEAAAEKRKPKKNRT